MTAKVIIGKKDPRAAIGMGAVGLGQSQEFIGRESWGFDLLPGVAGFTAGQLSLLRL